MDSYEVLDKKQKDHQENLQKLEMSLQAIRAEGGALSDLAAILGVSSWILGLVLSLAAMALIAAVFALARTYGSLRNAWIVVVLITLLVAGCIFAGYKIEMYPLSRSQATRVNSAELAKHAPNFDPGNESS